MNASVEAAAATARLRSDSLLGSIAETFVTGQFFASEPLAAVGDLEDDSILVHARAEGDPSERPVVLDSVLEEVVDQLAEQPGITVNHRFSQLVANRQSLLSDSCVCGGEPPPRDLVERHWLTFVSREHTPGEGEQSFEQSLAGDDYAPQLRCDLAQFLNGIARGP